MNTKQFLLRVFLATCLAATVVTQETNKCNSNPCQNGGTCIEGIQKFFCQCKNGFTGDTCEGDINECSPNPCHNGGTCRDGINGYTCNCSAGFTGLKCEIDEYSCRSSPCQNFGACISAVNSYVCICDEGFTGANCETTDHCASNPCLNGGTCKNQGVSFACTCTTGYTGDRCQTNLCIFTNHLDLALISSTYQPCPTDNCAPTPCECSAFDGNETKYSISSCSGYLAITNATGQCEVMAVHVLTLKCNNGSLKGTGFKSDDILFPKRDHPSIT